jgi:hypothetical protein
MAGSSASSQKWNLKDPRDLDAAYRLSFAGGWTHASTGATPNGTNAVADTFYTYNDATTNDTHLSYYSRTTSTPNVGQARYPVEIGNGTAPGSPYREFTLNVCNDISPNIAFTSRQYSDPAQPGQIDGQVYALNSGTTPGSQGFFIGTRISTTSHKGYKNGVQIGATNTTTNTYTLTGGHKIQLAKGVGGSYSNRECAFASIGLGLTDSEALTYSSIVQRYQTALSRAIVAIPTVQDINAQNFLVAAGITDSTQAQAVQNLVTELKYNSLWNKLQAIYPFVGSTSTTQKFNLKSPFDTNAAFRLAFNGGWTHSSTGSLGNGTNAYAATGILANTLSKTNAHLSLYQRINYTPSGVRIDLGAFNETTFEGPILATEITTGTTRARLFKNALDFSATDNRGFFQVTTDATNTYLYKNGSQVATIAASGGTQPAFNILIGAITSDTGIKYYSPGEYAFASLGDYLNSSESSTFNTIVTAYQTALSRNV